MKSARGPRQAARKDTVIRDLGDRKDPAKDVSVRPFPSSV